jgi:hypothetical protein
MSDRGVDYESEFADEASAAWGPSAAQRENRGIHMSDQQQAHQTPQQKPGKGHSDGRGLRAVQLALALALPVLVPLSFVLVLVSGFNGFGHPMGIYQPLPIYIVLSLCLLYVQAILWEKHPPFHFILFLVIGLVAIMFAGVYFILGATFRINGPPLYYGANVVLLVGFIIDAVRRRITPAQGVPSLAASAVLGNTGAKGGSRRRRLLRNLAMLAADAIGLGVLFGLCGAAVYEFEHGVPLLEFVYKLEPNLQPVGSPVNHVPFPFQPANSPDLWQLDVIVAVVLALIVGSLSLAAVALLVRATQTPEQMGRVLREAGTQVRESLRPIGVIPWLAASSVVALLANGLTNYYKLLATETSNTMWDLINPLRNPYPDSYQKFFAPELISFAAGLIVAVALVIIAAVCTEFDVAIVYRTVATLQAAGRSLAYVLFPMLVALTATNAVAFFFHPTTLQPFQFGLTGLIASALFVLALINFGVARRRDKPK